MYCVVSRVNEVAHQHLYIKKLSAILVARLHTVINKKIVWLIPKVVCRCFNENNKTFLVVPSPWTKHGNTSTHLRQKTIPTIGCQWKVCIKTSEVRTFNREIEVTFFGTNISKISFSSQQQSSLVFCSYGREIDVKKITRFGKWANTIFRNRSTNGSCIRWVYQREKEEIKLKNKYD